MRHISRLVVVAAGAAAAISLASPAVAADGGACSETCYVGGTTEEGAGTAVGPARGFHYRAPGNVSTTTVTNSGTAFSGHLVVDRIGDNDGSLAGAYVATQDTTAGHATGTFGDCSGLGC